MFGLLLGPVLTVGSAMVGRWLTAVVWGILTIAFLALAYGWCQAAWCRIDLEDNEARRRGPLGWAIPLDDIAGYEIRTIFGGPYVVLVPRLPPAKRTMARVLLGRSLPAGSLVGPVDRAKVEQIRAVLDSRSNPATD